MAVTRHEELRVYREGFRAAMRIFEASQGWPKDEKYSLTDQIRRSSRSVCANVAEAWRKRRYEKHFVSKLSDADAEAAAETRTWLRFANQCGYLADDNFDDLDETYDQLCAGLVSMMKNAQSWCGPSKLREPPAPYEANGAAAPDTR